MKADGHYGKRDDKPSTIFKSFIRYDLKLIFMYLYDIIRPKIETI